MKYTINKGSFSPKGLYLPGFGKASPASRTYTVNFSQSAWHEPSLDPERDWAKVLGWSIGFLPYLPKPGQTFYKGRPHKWWRLSDWEPAHHLNSLRLVNRPGGTKDDPNMELALYYYVGGVRQIFPLMFPYQLGEDLEVTLMNTQRGGMQASHVGGSSKQGVDTGILFPKGWGYTLKPNAGGTFPAWNTYTITILPQ